MTFTKKKQQVSLMVLIAVMVLINAYRFMTAENPMTAPLVYARGAVASSRVRQGLLSQAEQADPLTVFLLQRKETYPGVARDIFRMENVVDKPKREIVPQTPPPPPAPTPQELAADAARAELSKFRFLGYLTEKDSTLFLSKDNELFIVKKGDIIQKNYKVKEAKSNFVVMLDIATGVETRVELPGGEIKSSEPIQQQIQHQRRIRNIRPR